MAVKKDVKTLELAEPFVSLFPISPETLRLVTDSIRERGYQADKPILVWRDAFGERGRTVVVDGHTRLRAAVDLKLPEIWATVRQFKNVDEAITNGIDEQVQRRNLTRAQIAMQVISILPLLDETKYGLRTRTAKQLAKMLGVSVPTIDRARGVIGSGDEELIGKVRRGELSLRAAYEAATDHTPPSPTVPERSGRLADLEAGIADSLGREPIPGQVTVEAAIADVTAEAGADEEEDEVEDGAPPIDYWVSNVKWGLKDLDEKLDFLKWEVLGAGIHLEDGTVVVFEKIVINPSAEDEDAPVLVGDGTHWLELADVIANPEAVDLPDDYEPGA